MSEVSAAEKIPVDSVDRRLLRHLLDDPRVSIRGLARAVGMSAGAVGERLERLENRGVIRGYHADIDPAAVGLGLEVLICIQLAQHSEVLDTIEQLRQLSEVSQVDTVSGGWDVIVRVHVRDQHHLKELLTEGIWKVPNLRHSESMIVLENTTDDAYLLTALN